MAWAGQIGGQKKPWQRQDKQGWMIGLQGQRRQTRESPIQASCDMINQISGIHE